MLYPINKKSLNIKYESLIEKLITYKEKYRFFNFLEVFN
jgi:hypothetical protein